MASTAGRISGDLLDALFRTARWTHAPLSGAGVAAAQTDSLTTRAIAGAGFASLFALPLLLLSSALVTAPLAMPVAIGIGYLPLARTMQAHGHARAGLWGSVVFGALFVWLAAHLAMGGGRSTPGLVAALLAPLVAAAPAIARLLLAPKAAPAVVEHDLRQAALQRLRCLEELAPAETMLVLDGRGVVLGASPAARRLLRLLPDAIESRVDSVFASDDAALLLNAMERCARGEAVEVRLAGHNCAGTLKATLSRCSDDTVAVRLQTWREELMPSQKVARMEAQAAAEPPLPICDIGEALGFTLEHLRRKAEARSIGLSLNVEAGAAAVCDIQLGRRILRGVIDAAIKESRDDTELDISARRLRSVVLIRAACRRDPAADVGSDTEMSGKCRRESDAALHSLAEAAGGTLVVVREAGDLTFTVRLPAADKTGARSERERSHVG